MDLSETLKVSKTSLFRAVRIGFVGQNCDRAAPCTYYFGPFTCAKSAQKAISGYIEDLNQESAQVIAATLKRIQPRELTIESDELAENFEIQLPPEIAGES